MAWWQMLGKPARETLGDKAHTISISIDSIDAKDTAQFLEKNVRMIQPVSIHLVGMELERAVQKEVVGHLDWELGQMQYLLIELAAMHFTVSLHTCRSGWCCDVKRGDILGPDDDCVREFGENSPAIALARAAVAAVRQWPN